MMKTIIAITILWIVVLGILVLNLRISAKRNYEENRNLPIQNEEQSQQPGEI